MWETERFSIYLIINSTAKCIFGTFRNAVQLWFSTDDVPTIRKLLKFVNFFSEKVLNAFQNIQPKNGWEDNESNVGDDQSFQHDEASVPASLHFTKRGLASAPAFTSRMESEDEDKYIEISKLRPRSLGMMSTGSQLQKMALNSVCN